MFNAPLHIVMRCDDAIVPKARYVFDTLLMARGIPLVYSTEPPATGLWLSYSPMKEQRAPHERCLAVAYCPESWRLFAGRSDVRVAESVDGLVAVLPQGIEGFHPETDITFDIIANAFYFLSSWSERVESAREKSRRMHASSVFTRLRVPQDIVDQYVDRLATHLLALCERNCCRPWNPIEWPQGSEFALVLSHDVDFVPSGLVDTLTQGAKTVFRHLIRERDMGDTLVVMWELARALATGRDVYGCVPEIIAKEKALGVCASFQVAVGRRHPNDVNYRIEDDIVRDYLRVIPDSGFDLCLHGSYRSTENPHWYADEAALLSQRLGTPAGSRQHFLSFDYDALFAAQERSRIRYDMSMGFPDRTGPRAGFSSPYFPYCLEDDRPYDVVEISLFLMDVTLRSYMRLNLSQARDAIEDALDDLRHKRGCVSAVWHPIVFGGARDPGYARLFWDMVAKVKSSGGLATDGRTIDKFWRNHASKYASFSGLFSSHTSTVPHNR